MDRMILKPPFEETDEKRREYLLRRITGSPVLPSPDFSRDEDELTLLIDWILEMKVPWAAAIRQDIRELLDERLSGLDSVLADTNGERGWELGGLLMLAIRTHDVKCANQVRDYLRSGKDGGIPDSFESIADTDGLYDPLGLLMFRVLQNSELSKADVIPIFENGIQTVHCSRQASYIFRFLAKRDPDRAWAQIGNVVEVCMAKRDEGSLKRILRISKERCFSNDPMQTANGFTRKFIEANNELRRLIGRVIHQTLWRNFSAV